MYYTPTKEVDQDNDYYKTNGSGAKTKNGSVY